jgi:hypothetical protein
MCHLHRTFAVVGARFTSAQQAARAESPSCARWVPDPSAGKGVSVMPILWDVASLAAVILAATLVSGLVLAVEKL